MTKTRFLALLSVLALLATMPLASVFAQQPVPPQKYYGMVMVNGEAPPEGTTVMAFVEQEVMEGDQTMTKTVEIGMAKTDAMGNYVLTTDDDSMLQGMEVMFSIMLMGMEDSQDAMPYTMMDGEKMMVDSVMWMQGDASQLNLEVGKSIVRPDGTTGPAPVVGPRGPQGPQGPQGEPGPAGEDGHDGHDGARGPAGPAGPAGADGSDGSDGARGATGAAGSDGADGSDGAQGPQGPAGPAGSAGNDGAMGPAGPAGAAGADGGGGAIAWVALIIAIVGVLAAGGAFMAGRRA